ncbi:ABC transporter substrate-binding protein [soil metagenome]
MRRFRMLALGASLLVLAGACGTGGGSPTTQPSPATSPAGSTGIRIGSAGFYESALVAEIYAQVLEANGYSVDRQLEIGPRTVTFPALESGQFDMMPEYIGSTLEYVVQDDGDPGGEASNDTQATLSSLQARLNERGLTVLGPTTAQDYDAFVMRPSTAESLGISQMSDLAEHAQELTWGVPPECATNPLCAGQLEDPYGIDFASLEVIELGACGGEIAAALGTAAEGAVDIGLMCSTQPDIARFGLLLLEDDQGVTPAQNLAPIFRNEWLEAAGGAQALAAILDPVSAELTTEDLTELNVRVGLDQEDFEVVAREWLEEQGMLP